MLVDYLEYAKFDGDVLYVCFRPLLQAFSEKFIKHFDITWLISQQFIRLWLFCYFKSAVKFLTKIDFAN